MQRFFVLGWVIQQCSCKVAYSERFQQTASYVRLADPQVRRDFSLVREIGSPSGSRVIARLLVLAMLATDAAGNEARQVTERLVPPLILSPEDTFRKC